MSFPPEWIAWEKIAGGATTPPPSPKKVYLPDGTEMTNTEFHGLIGSLRRNRISVDDLDTLHPNSFFHGHINNFVDLSEPPKPPKPLNKKSFLQPFTQEEVDKLISRTYQETGEMPEIAGYVGDPLSGEWTTEELEAAEFGYTTTSDGVHPIVKLPPKQDLPVTLNGVPIGKLKSITMVTPGETSDWPKSTYLQGPDPDGQATVKAVVDVNSALHEVELEFDPATMTDIQKTKLSRAMDLGFDKSISIGYLKKTDGSIMPFEAALVEKHSDGLGLPLASEGEEEDNRSMAEDIPKRRSPNVPKMPDLTINVKGMNDFRQKIKTISKQLGLSISTALGTLGADAVKAAMATQEFDVAMKKIQEDIAAAQTFAGIEKTTGSWEQRYSGLKQEFLIFQAEANSKLAHELQLLKDMRKALEGHTTDLKDRLKTFEGTCDSCEFFKPLQDAEGERVGICGGLSLASWAEHLGEELFASLHLPLLADGETAYLRVSSDFRCNQHRKDPDWVEPTPLPSPPPATPPDEVTWNCPDCGQANADTSRFCINCKCNKIRPPSSDVWTCGACGETHNPYNVFKCVNCSSRKNYWTCPDCNTNCSGTQGSCNNCGRNLVGNSWQCLHCGSGLGLHLAGCLGCGTQRNAVRLKYKGEWTCSCGLRIPGAFNQCGDCGVQKCESCGYLEGVKEQTCTVCHYNLADNSRNFINNTADVGEDGDYIDDDDWKVPPSSPVGTVTGRMSSSPNFQDVFGPSAYPKRTMFRHPSGADYVCSQCLQTVPGKTSLCPNCSAQHWECPSCHARNYSKTKTACGSCGTSKPRGAS
jgi:hypothetical protein